MQQHLPRLARTRHTHHTHRHNPTSPPLPPVSPPDLAALHTLLDRNLPRALALAEGGGVTRFVGEASRRVVYQVRAGGQHGHGHAGPARRGPGSGGGGTTAPAAHTTFPPHYCDCDAFYFDVVHKGDAAACKHQLAARLVACFLPHSTAGEVVLPDVVLARLLIAGG